MKHEVAQQININLNHPKIIDTIKLYIDDRIELLNRELQQSTDTTRIFRLQGSILELTYLKNIRENSIGVLENGRHLQKGN